MKLRSNRSVSLRLTVTSWIAMTLRCGFCATLTYVFCWNDGTGTHAICEHETECVTPVNALPDKPMLDEMTQCPSGLAQRPLDYTQEQNDGVMMHQLCNTIVCTNFWSDQSTAAAWFSTCVQKCARTFAQTCAPLAAKAEMPGGSVATANDARSQYVGTNALNASACSQFFKRWH